MPKKFEIEIFEDELYENKEFIVEVSLNNSFIKEVGGIESIEEAVEQIKNIVLENYANI